MSTTALMYAVVTGNLSTVEVLLDANVTVNIADNQGFNALLLAAKYGFLDIVEKLLINNADLTVSQRGKKWTGKTTLHAFLLQKKMRPLVFVARKRIFLIRNAPKPLAAAKKKPICLNIK